MNVSLTHHDAALLRRLAAQDGVTPQRYAESALSAAIKIGSAGLGPVETDWYACFRKVDGALAGPGTRLGKAKGPDIEWGGTMPHPTALAALEEAQAEWERRFGARWPKVGAKFVKPITPKRGHIHKAACPRPG